MVARTVVVPLGPGSDGDYTHAPPKNLIWSIIDPPILYLERIALQWMQDRNEAKPGVKYMLERLPAGYTLHERPRANGTKDKYLFGHPSHKQFDSPNRFYPHFKHMMENHGDMIGCPCTVCDPRGGVLPGKPPSTSTYFGKSASTKGNSSDTSARRVSSENSRSGNSTTLRKPTSMSGNPTSAKVPYSPIARPKSTFAGMDTTRVDEEGTPDVYRNLIDKLKRYGTLDEAIKEPLSLDWRAEQEGIPDSLRKAQCDPQWIPRVGDILLYIRNMPKGFEIAHDPQTGEYQLCNLRSGVVEKKAVWEAGLVSQAPVEPVEGEVEWYVSQTGVRIEPLPNPNDTNKSMSKHYAYVPVEHTRPFCLWEDFIGYVPRDERHPTIENAFTVSATMSLIGKHRFHGNWPNAQIYCHAIYIGPELIAVGDTVRLAPKAGDDDNVVTDVLIVNTIRLRLSNLGDASWNDYDEGRPYNSEIWVYGSAFTTQASRTSKEWLSEDNTQIPKSASGYGPWYPLHPPAKELAVPFSRIVGRLYEHEALQSWVPNADLDSGRYGVLDARHFASKNDKRIVSNAGTTWFWAESRADALDLHTINGLDVSKHDVERDPKEWRKNVKVIESKVALPDRKPASHMHSLQRFMAPGTTLPYDSTTSPGTSTATIDSKQAGKRAVIEISDDEDVRQQTRIVTNIRYKKPKVQVVIN